MVTMAEKFWNDIKKNKERIVKSIIDIISKISQGIYSLLLTVSRKIKECCIWLLCALSSLWRVIIAIIPYLLFLGVGVYLFYLEITKQTLDLKVVVLSQWELLAASLVSFSIFLYIIHHFHKKLWFGLAIVFFVVAGLVAYWWIFEVSNPPDETVLTSGSEFDIFPREIIKIPPRDTADNWIRHINPGRNKNLSINASYEDIREFLQEKNNLSWTANHSMVCKPVNREFTEGGRIICYPNIKVPLNFSANSMWSRQERSIYARLCVNVTSFDYQQNYSELKVGNGQGYENSLKNFSVSLSTYGNQKVTMSFLFCTRYLTIKNYSNDQGDHWGYDPLIQYTGDFYIKSREEISKQQRERNYQLIIALFAIFGIFPAVYHLRNLWRNEK